MTICWLGIHDNEFIDVKREGNSHYLTVTKRCRNCNKVRIFKNLPEASIIVKEAVEYTTRKENLKRVGQ